MSETHVLYRFFSATGQLLYVGITMSPPQRFHAHRSDKDWWELVSGITIENYSTRADLVAAERRAIQVEKPKHNIIHNRQSNTLANPVHAGANRQIAVGMPRYKCAACGLGVSKKSGYVHVSYMKIHAHEEHRNARHANNGRPKLYSVAELESGPPRAHWMVHHRNCDPNPDSNDYWVGLERIQTYEQLIRWTAHIMEKSWIVDTDWSRFLRSHLPESVQAL